MQIFNEFRTSVERALTEIDPRWREYRGLVVCGTHTPDRVEDIITQIKKAREDGTPYLGICFGHQLGAIEYARNVLGIEDATSEEFGEGTFVVRKLPELHVGLHDGESWWHNYEVDPDLLDKWEKPENFFTCQYHPEYQSSKEKPHPFLVKFIEYARENAKV